MSSCMHQRIFTTRCHHILVCKGQPIVGIPTLFFLCFGRWKGNTYIFLACKAWVLDKVLCQTYFSLLGKQVVSEMKFHLHMFALLALKFSVRLDSEAISRISREALFLSNYWLLLANGLEPEIGHLEQAAVAGAEPGPAHP